MWIVRLALNRPYTFIVLAILTLLLSPAVILRTPTDIFPNIDIPVISVAWSRTAAYHLGATVPAEAWFGEHRYSH